jgi:hypothetical protein
MAVHDPFWGMPEENWQPTSSFNSPIAPPLDDPLVGPLVQLPCVNVQWVPIILGCLAQLTDPGVWDQALTDDQRSLVLNRVDNLRSAMAGTVSTPCCDVTLRLTTDCKLQFSVDAGAHWSDVDGWTTNICACVTGCIVPPVPPNPGGIVVNQEACNLAGYLAVNVLQATMDIAQALLNTADEVVSFVHNLANDLTVAFPIAAILNDAAYAFWGYYVSGVRADFQSAAADSTLWSNVTCAIYNAIKSVGYVESSNLAAVRANICAVSYAHADVINALCAFVDHLPLLAWQLMQTTGALDDVDCTTCGTSCHLFDFEFSSAGAGIGTGVCGFGHWVSHLGGSALNGGWQSTGPATGCLGGETVLNLHLPFGIPVHFHSVKFRFGAGDVSPGSSRRVQGYLGGSLVFNINSPTQGHATYPAFDTVTNDAVIDTLIIFGDANGTSTYDVDAVQVTFNGPDPFAPTPCVF